MIERKFTPKDYNCKCCPYYKIEPIETITPLNDQPTGNYRYIHKCVLYNKILSVKDDSSDNNIHKCLDCSLISYKEEKNMNEDQYNLFLFGLFSVFMGIGHKWEKDDKENADK